MAVLPVESEITITQADKLDVRVQKEAIAKTCSHYYNYFQLKQPRLSLQIAQNIQ